MRRLSLPAGDHGLRLLVLGAHADDIEIGCGGTIMRLISEGRLATVTWVVFSAAGERTSEARSGADTFLTGLPDRDVVLHQFRDGYFPYEGGRIKNAFEGLKSQLTPDLILTHRREDLHQDHRLVSELTWNTFRDHVILEFEIPKYDGDLGPTNIYVELDEPTAARKVDAIMTTFRSQATRRWFTPETFRAILRLRGVEANAESGVAEGFFGRKLVL